MEEIQFECAKCAGTACDTGEIRSAGSFLSALFNHQGRRFTTVTCTNCKYTDLYQTESSGIGKILDVITG